MSLLHKCNISRCLTSNHTTSLPSAPRIVQAALNPERSSVLTCGIKGPFDLFTAEPCPPGHKHKCLVIFSRVSTGTPPPGVRWVISKIKRGFEKSSDAFYGLWIEQKEIKDWNVHLAACCLPASSTHIFGQFFLINHPVISNEGKVKFYFNLTASYMYKWHEWKLSQRVSFFQHFNPYCTVNVCCWSISECIDFFLPSSDCCYWFLCKLKINIDSCLLLCFNV